MSHLPYDPGVLPTKPPPRPGDEILIELLGLPPYKDVHQSIRNSKHPRYAAFRALRQKAIEVMDGRAWYFGPVQLDLTIYAPALHEGRSLNDYLGGILDTLDGSSGVTFTYLPIAFEDDCQVASCQVEFTQAPEEKYRVCVTFLGN